MKLLLIVLIKNVEKTFPVNLKLLKNIINKFIYIPFN